LYIIEILYLLDEGFYVQTFYSARMH